MNDSTNTNFAADGNFIVDIEELTQYPLVENYGIRNYITTEQLNSAIVDGGAEGLMLDLSVLADDNGDVHLLDGSTVNVEDIYGTVYVGPYPLESEENEWHYERFRRGQPVENGRGLINTSYLVSDDHNSEGWIDNGIVGVRAILYEQRDGEDRPLGDPNGIYGTYTAFQIVDENGNQVYGDEGDSTIKRASFIETPAVNMITSDDPTSMVISFRTAEPVMGTVEIEGLGSVTSEEPATEHIIPITGLSPDTEYTYRVTVGSEEEAVTLPTTKFTTAPLPGELPSDGSHKTIFLSDSREGSLLYGTEAYMGVNADTLERLLNIGWQQGGDLAIYGGDLVNGYTASPDDFRTQLRAYKQVMSPYRSQAPVYPAMGNHESLLRNFDDGSGFGISVDRFDENGSYDTVSAEAVFADEFINPENAPEPSNPDRPPYDENLYSFQHGPVKYVAFNNNYWVSYASEEVGGNPEGYMFQDQLDWLEGELEAAESDPTVNYVILYAQEPPFPNGGHSDDSMWYADLEEPPAGEYKPLALTGDNNVRAHTYDSETGELVPEEKGIIEVRNQFAEMLADSSKVAAVMAGDEHSFHRVLIDDGVPIGDVDADDDNGNGIIGDNGEDLSTLSNLENPVWYITAGAAGAPYYSEELTPWQQYWLEQENPEEGFFYSSQESVVVFDADDEKISMEVYSIKGELIDRVDDLMAVKKDNPAESGDDAEGVEDPLSLLGTYETGIYGEGAAEIVAYDPQTQRLFVANSSETAIDIINIEDPTNPSLVERIDISDLGAAATSVAVSDGIVAAAISNEDPQEPGIVAFMNADGEVLNTVSVGPLPDAVVFSPDGEKLLVANEGEPSDDYANDPQGSVSIIDVSGSVADLTDADVTTAGFQAFNDREAVLTEAGVRIYGPDASVAQDLEPENITISEDSQTAWVVLQENNALGVLDVASGEFTDIVPLGFKDYSEPDNALDASDEDGEINIADYDNLFGMYQPDGIASYEVDGETYIVTANEGDSRDYEAFSEEVRVSELNLDPEAFPNAEELQTDENLGRLLVTNTRGQGEAGDYEELYAYGGRSFAIWDTEGNLVFESGDELEQITAELLPDQFNSDNEANDTFDQRSDDKGPEPEGLVVGEVEGTPYAFIGLERIGGVVAYNVSDPTNPKFVDYINTRNFEGDAEAGTAGDLGPEGLTFISPEDSPTGNALISVAYEISGSTSVYEFDPEAETTEVATEPVFGSLEGEVLEVEGSNELIFVGEGDDLVDASLGEGDNRIYGDGSDDIFILGTGDRLVGAAGADRFFVTNGGDNTITGGAGADQFWITSAELPETANTITDFLSGEDVIGVAGLGIGFEDLSITQDGDNTLIGTGDRDLAVLSGIDSNSLTADNFAFV